MSYSLLFSAPLCGGFQRPLSKSTICRGRTDLCKVICPANKRILNRGSLRGVVQCNANSLKETPSFALSEIDAVVKEIPSSSGIYAIFDKDGELQYMGMSRKMSTSIAGHLQDLPNLCHEVKFSVVSGADKSALVEAWKGWMEEHVAISGKAPPGNEQGNATWTARRKRSKQDIKLTPGAHVKLTVPITELVDKVVKEFGVVAFIKGTRTSPQCGFSHRVLTILNESRVDYETLNVLDEDANPGLREAVKEYSEWPTIPQVFVKGEFIGGADILDEMVQSGELAKVLSQK